MIIGQAPTRRTLFRTASCARCGMILYVVLILITLLAVLGASFSFHMNADLASAGAGRNLQQARLAAESGIDQALSALLTDRKDMELWYDNRDLFRRVPVWMPDRDPGSTSLADKTVVEGQPAWRYSIITYDLQSDQDQSQNNQMQVRYGLVDENSKFNLNSLDTSNPDQARKQLLALLDGIPTEDVDPRALADSLIDWMDEDDQPVSDQGAESGYYMTCDPPYRAKNRELDTVEELLMVKGFTGRILYGEDYNRNGFLDPNENDGEEEGSLFPPDNGDGKLNRGLLPYVTVYTRDWNLLYDNKININMVGTAKLPEVVSQNLGDELIEFIKNVRSAGHTFESVGELYRLEVWENGWSEYYEFKQQYEEKQQEGEKEEEGAEDEQWDQPPGDELPGQEEEGLEDEQPGDERLPGDEQEQEGIGGDEQEFGEEDLQDLPESLRDKDKNRRRLKAMEAPADGNLPEPGGEAGPPTGSPQQGEDVLQGQEEQGGAESNQGEDKSGEEDKNKKLECPGGPPKYRSPVQDEQTLALAMQYLTSAEDVRVGLININTAPARVLKTLPALTGQEVEAIINARKNLDSTQKASCAWLATSSVLEDYHKFSLLCDKITAEPCQFTINAIGFADHVGTAKRIQVVIDLAPDMLGDLLQMMSNKGSQFQPSVLVKYYRDITPLRIGYPLTEEAERRLGIATGTE